MPGCFAASSCVTTLQHCRQKRPVASQAALTEHMLVCIAAPQAKSGQLCSILSVCFLVALFRGQLGFLVVCLSPAQCNLTTALNTCPSNLSRLHSTSLRQMCNNHRAVPARAASNATHVQQHEDTPKTRAGSELQLHNTMGRRKQTFQPRPNQGQDVSMYVCGVTVYDW